MTHPLLLLPDAALFSLYCHKKSLTDKRLTHVFFWLQRNVRRCLPGPAGDIFEDFTVRDLLGLLEHGGWEAGRGLYVRMLTAVYQKLAVFPLDAARAGEWQSRLGRPES